jgi:hypothetical protein
MKSGLVFLSEQDSGGLMIVGARGENPNERRNRGLNPSRPPDGEKILFATTGFLTSENVLRGGLLAIVDLATSDVQRNRWRERYVLAKLGGSRSADHLLEPPWQPPAASIRPVSSAKGQPIGVTNDPRPAGIRFGNLMDGISIPQAIRSGPRNL